MEGSTDKSKEIKRPDDYLGTFATFIQQLLCSITIKIIYQYYYYY